MYTGTLIRDLMATVDRVEKQVDEQCLAEELHAIFTMQIPITEREPVFKGAA